jgi:hypothetical protein
MRQKTENPQCMLPHLIGCIEFIFLNCDSPFYAKANDTGMNCEDIVIWPLPLQVANKVINLLPMAPKFL